MNFPELVSSSPRRSQHPATRTHCDMACIGRPCPPAPDATNAHSASLSCNSTQPPAHPVWRNYTCTGFARHAVGRRCGTFGHACGAFQNPARGIATGDVFRHLVSRAIATMWMHAFDEATRPSRYALKARAGTDALAAHVRTALELRDDAAPTTPCFSPTGQFWSPSCRRRSVADVVEAECGT